MANEYLLKFVNLIVYILRTQNKILMFIRFIYLKYFLEKESTGSPEDKDAFCLAKSYFHLKEYDRAAFFSKPLTSHRGKYYRVLKKHL